VRIEVLLLKRMNNKRMRSNRFAYLVGKLLRSGRLHEDCASTLSSVDQQDPVRGKAKGPHMFGKPSNLS
jgi:hypothetical protein